MVQPVEGKVHHSVVGEGDDGDVRSSGSLTSSLMRGCRRRRQRCRLCCAYLCHGRELLRREGGRRRSDGARVLGSLDRADPEPGASELVPLGVLALEVVGVDHEGRRGVEALVEELHARGEELVRQPVDLQLRVGLMEGRHGRGEEQSKSRH